MLSRAVAPVRAPRSRTLSPMVTGDGSSLVDCRLCAALFSFPYVAATGTIATGTADRWRRAAVEPIIAIATATTTTTIAAVTPAEAPAPARVPPPSLPLLLLLLLLPLQAPLPPTLPEGMFRVLVRTFRTPTAADTATYGNPANTFRDPVVQRLRVAQGVPVAPRRRSGPFSTCCCRRLRSGRPESKDSVDARRIHITGEARNGGIGAKPAAAAAGRPLAVGSRVGVVERAGLVSP